jgi:hypothetical protein
MRVLSTIPKPKDESMRALITTPGRARSVQARRVPRLGANRLPQRFAHSVRRAIRADPDTSGCGEKWVTKRQVAAHLGVSIRFIEAQHELGMPVLRMSTINRYRVSEVEAWMREYYSPTTALQEM